MGRYLPVLMLFAVIIGCQSMALSYKGTPARPDNRFPLVASEGDPVEWKAKDMALYYEMAPEEGALDIRGTVKRLDSIKKYPVVSYFRVSLHFIDADGIIIDSHQLCSAGNQIDQRSMSAGPSRSDFPYRPERRPSVSVTRAVSTKTAEKWPAKLAGKSGGCPEAMLRV